MGGPECLLWGLVRGPHRNTEGQDPFTPLNIIKVFSQRSEKSMHRTCINSKDKLWRANNKEDS
ncbi:MAG: hypothetical protein A3F82_04225 [Deltaproteobacteria bacterium RIFCSPLOWO2_12_FULL_44_12]|nr:MAG: hypothetical protein A2712_08235 [Deltaproteobacteria bacterium RIFCSPHIGHO2_01_FULL_43_49]OGQ14674.1 MAG: hypothetical protein A3D22_08765 [Deltaproteobacteria bacterium RIFCSPHIGHO2_02_FULL_44_53]OGQ28060.1 MAG: hypothetical protein A3D98_07475 [Deltaproteobacteria bacterium RIFCSPHIGHO2_12_FULL_44_21]OGQ31272.1 MAG: hypothetical protein A2979_07525 [Deltaproteobacteria bacterium RIFCSPLOWO2_01_FULL_45_74]OGQ43264.1 MAG: hypothetical protein A3I70_01185 [Deltaproteobacteria bacterium 